MLYGDNICVDDLKVAREKATKSTVTSDVDTATSDIEKVKSRQRRQKKFNVESSDEADETFSTPVPPSKVARTKTGGIAAHTEQLLLPPPLPVFTPNNAAAPKTPVQSHETPKSGHTKTYQQPTKTPPNPSEEQRKTDLDDISKRGISN